MGLLDDLTPTKRIYGCRVRDVRNTLDKADQERLDAMIADSKNWAVNTLARALQSKGLDIKTHSITRHRDGVCSCSKI